KEDMQLAEEAELLLLLREGDSRCQFAIDSDCDMDQDGESSGQCTQSLDLRASYTRQGTDVSKSKSTLPTRPPSARRAAMAEARAKNSSSMSTM
ncbi:hypothetical protein CYMTET_43970, partial [Cymbomonas tetramitiformis]